MAIGAARNVLRINKGDQNPVGMIVQSMLTEPQFQDINGEGWILSDGRPVTGSTYEAITGNANAPDLRGLVLRGQNNGRVDGNQNPDNPALGVFQDHAFSSHQHGGNSGIQSANHTHVTDTLKGGGIAYGSTAASSANTNTNTGQTSSTNSVNHTHAITSEGGNENRMRNMTVNTFIKIS
jgi:hypothetical protein